MKQSKLQVAKNIAVKMLYEDIIPYDEYNDLFLCHPFFETAFLADKDGIFDYRREPNRLHKVRERIKEELQNAKTVKNVLFRIRKAFKIDYIYALFETNAFSDLDCGLLLRHIWTEIENNELQPDDITYAMEQWLNAVPRDKLMNESDYQVYRSLPETVTVYRGVQNNETPVGFSWSTSKDTAMWFASRFDTDNQPTVCQLTVPKSDILFYTNDVDEQEIVLSPSKIDPDNILFL